MACLALKGDAVATAYMGRTRGTCVYPASWPPVGIVDYGSILEAYLGIASR